MNFVAPEFANQPPTEPIKYGMNVWQVEPKNLPPTEPIEYGASKIQVPPENREEIKFISQPQVCLRNLYSFQSVHFDNIVAKAAEWKINLRPGQMECIAKMLNRESVLLSLTTGGGKSLCYQLYVSLKKSERTLVIFIAPLTAILEEQYASCSKRKVCIL